MAGEDYGKRQTMGQAAWIKPKQRRLEMMNGLFQIMTPLIFCFRAREKTKQIANDRGKQVPTNIGWTPIAPPEIVHNMTIFALLPIKSDGVPMWKGNTAYEDFSIKLPRAFQGLFPEGERITRKMGHAMSVWALGDQKLNGQSIEEPETKPAAAQKDKNPAPRAAGPEGAAAEAHLDNAEFVEVQPEDETERPTETASAQSAEAEQATSASATVASSDSAAAAPGTTGAQPQASSAIPEEFTTFAVVCADAKTWEPIREALPPLKRTAAWKEAAPEMHVRLHSMAFSRLLELIHNGYRFDFTDDLHAYRCYLDHEEDAATLKLHRDMVHKTKLWMDLPTDAKIVFDRAYNAAEARIAGAAAYA